MTKKWTEAELEILRNSHNKPIPKIEGRNEQSIRIKMFRLGLKTKPKQPKWSQEEIKSLFEFKEKAKLPGRTRRAILVKIKSLGIKSSIPNIKWQREELDLLKNYDGKNIPKIQGRTLSAIKTKMKSLGLFKPKFKTWSQQEIDKLVRMYENGIKKIAIIGRSVAAVRKKINELGLNNSIKGKNWTKKEIDNLKNGKFVVGRSAKSIMRKKKELGIISKKDYRRKWTKEEELVLFELKSQGKSADKIFKSGILKGHSETAIQKKLCRMGLAKKMKTKSKKLPPYIKLKLNNFLTNNWKGKTPEELAEIWSTENARYPVNVKGISSRLKKLGIKISCHEVLKIKNLKKKEQEIIERFNGSSIGVINEKIKAERIKLMRARVEKNIDMWTGLKMTQEEIEEINSISV